MAIGRRGFMAAIGLGAAAAPTMAPLLAREGSRNFSSGVGGALAQGSSAGETLGKMPIPVQPWQTRGITETLWRLWNSEATEAEDALQRYVQCNVQGHDPVVFACKSWSPAFGVSYTYNKLKGMQERTRTFRERLWSKP